MDYFKFGNGKDVFVILPGLSVQSVMGSAGMVADAYKILTDDFTVYTFDRIKDLPPDYSIDDMASDTAEAIKALGLHDVCLFGASQGGMLAIKIAASCPELVSKLILGSTSARIEDGDYGIISEWVSLAGKGDAEGLYFKFGEALYPTEVYEQSKSLLTDLAKTVTKEELERFVILAKSMKGLDIVGDLDKISCPTFVIGSMDDKVLGSEASELIAEHLRGIPGFKMHMYDGYGHAAFDMAPDYKERILKFLLEGN